MTIIDAATIFTICSAIFIGGILFPTLFQKKPVVISESRRNEIANELIHSEQAGRRKVKKKELKKNRTDVNAAAEALIAKVVQKEMDCEQNDQDLLTLITIQNQLNIKDNERKKSGMKKIPFIVPQFSEIPDEAPFAKAATATSHDGQIMDQIFSTEQETTYIGPVDLQSALNIIAKAKKTISIQNFQQSELESALHSNRMILQKSATDRSKFELEYQNLQDTNKLLSQSLSNARVEAKEYHTQAIQLRAQCEAYENEMQSFNTLKLTNCELMKEKSQMINRINQLQEQIANQNKLMKQKSKDWLQRMKSLQESSSSQILGLSGEMDTAQRELKNKIARLDAELKREQYEKDSQSLQLKLKNVQCEKSDREAFSARSLVNRLQEELKMMRFEREKQIILNSESQMEIKSLNHALNDLNMKLSAIEIMDQKIRKEKITLGLESALEQKCSEIAALKKELKECRELVEDKDRKLNIISIEKDTVTAHLNAANDYISSNQAAAADIDSKCEEHINIALLQSEIDIRLKLGRLYSQGE